MTPNRLPSARRAAPLSQPTHRVRRPSPSARRAPRLTKPAGFAARLTRPARLASAFLLAASLPAGLHAQAAGEEISREVRTLADHPRVQEAFEAVEALEPRTMREHVELTQIPAPPFMEEERARHYLEIGPSAAAPARIRHERGVRPQDD